MAEDIADDILENAQGPKRATGDSGSIEKHSLPDQIAADQYLKSKEAATKNPAAALHRTKFVPPGAS